MTIRFSSKIQSALLIGSVLMVSACATNNAGNTIASKPVDSPTVPQKAKVAPPPEQPKPSAKKVTEPVKTVSLAPVVPAKVTKAAGIRISPKEKLVNIRSMASVKSRKVAVLEGGHPIEVLEKKDSWLKIKWQKGDVVKQGWLKKAFVEGYEDKP